VLIIINPRRQQNTDGPRGKWAPGAGPTSRREREGVKEGVGGGWAPRRGDALRSCERRRALEQFATYPPPFSSSESSPPPPLPIPSPPPPPPATPRPPLQFHTKHTGKSIATKNPRFPLRPPPSAEETRRPDDCSPPAPPLAPFASLARRSDRSRARREEEPRADRYASEQIKGSCRGPRQVRTSRSLPSPPLPRFPWVSRSSLFRITRAGSGRSVCFPVGLPVCLFDSIAGNQDYAGGACVSVLPRIGQPWPARPLASARPPSVTGACFNLCLSVPAPLVSSWPPPCTSSARFRNALLINFHTHKKKE